MPRTTRKPLDLALTFARLRDEKIDAFEACKPALFQRETFQLPRVKAMDAAREWFLRYPRERFSTRIECWRKLDNGLIEFTLFCSAG